MRDRLRLILPGAGAPANGLFPAEMARSPVPPSPRAAAAAPRERRDGAGQEEAGARSPVRAAESAPRKRPGGSGKRGRPRRCLALCAALLMLAAPLPARAAAAGGERALVVYRTEAQKEALLTLLGDFGCPADSVESVSYLGQAREGYRYVVTASADAARDAEAAGCEVLYLESACGQADFCTVRQARSVGYSLVWEKVAQSAGFLDEALLIAEHSGEALGTVRRNSGDQSPFAVLGEGGAAVPSWDESPLGYLMLSAVVQRFLGRAVAEGKLYVILDLVYPYSDLQNLMDIGERLYADGIPYLLRVMPVYENLGYPSFQRYVQVLSFVQSRGASIVLNAPDLSEGDPGYGEIMERLAEMERALAEGGVVIQPMQAAPYKMTLSQFQALRTDEAIFPPLPMDAMVDVPLGESAEELEETVRALNSRWLRIADYKRGFVDEGYQYVKRDIDEDYVYIEAEERSFASLISASDKVLVIVVGALFGIFLVLAGIGFRLYRRKFS